MTLTLGLQGRIAQVRERIAAAARRAGRDPDAVTLVAVSKTVDRPAVVARLAGQEWLELRGLMTMAPLVTDPEETRPVFRALRQLRDDLRRADPDLDLADLSMGMTNDYPVAVEEGATIVRVGRAIF